MRKNLEFVVLALAIIATAGTGCKKDDVTAPTITLTGSSDITLSLPLTNNGAAAWEDPGFTASDDEDGTITSNVVSSGTVNPNRKGLYTITYTVSDAAGNQASATRTVRVVNDAEIFAGSYVDAVDTASISGVSLFDATITASDSINNLVSINNFGAFGSTANIYAAFSGTTVGSTISVATGQIIVTPTYIQNSYPAESLVLVNTSAAQSFSIKYQWNDGANSEVSISYYHK